MSLLPHFRLPRLFIGSSVEGLKVANALQENLDFDAEVTVWPQGVFEPNANTLSSLIASTTNFDFATFVFSPDDILEMRSLRAASVRDNVLFEYGLFCGAIGLTRCSFITPRDHQPMRLPTDLLGVTGLDFNASRSDQNLVAAVGAASNKLRRLFRDEGLRDNAFPSNNEQESASDRRSKAEEIKRYEDLWSSPEIVKARSEVRSIPFDPRDPEFSARRASIDKIYAFLESLSDAILTERVEESEARLKFEEAIVSFWGFAATTLLPVGHVDPDDWWDPLPSMGVLAFRWRKEVKP